MSDDHRSLAPYPRWAGLVVVLLFFAILGAAGLAGRALPLPRRVDRSAVSMGLMTGAVLIGTLGIVVFSMLVTRRNAAIADAAFAALGLGGAPYLIRGRRYQGVFADRRVDAYFMPPRRYVPASLEIYLASTSRTRVSFGPGHYAGSLVRRLAGQLEVSLDDPAYAHLSATAAEPAWAQRLAHDPAARTAILHLANDPAGGVIRFVGLDPEVAFLRISGVSLRTLTPDVVHRWGEALSALAIAAERLPPPAQALEASALDRAARSRKGVLPAAIVFVVVTLVVVGGIALGAVMMLANRR